MSPYPEMVSTPSTTDQDKLPNLPPPAALTGMLVYGSNAISMHIANIIDTTLFMFFPHLYANFSSLLLRDIYTPPYIPLYQKIKKNTSKISVISPFLYKTRSSAKPAPGLFYRIFYFRMVSLTCAAEFTLLVALPSIKTFRFRVIATLDFFSNCFAISL